MLKHPQGADPSCWDEIVPAQWLAEMVHQPGRPRATLPRLPHPPPGLEIQVISAYWE